VIIRHGKTEHNKLGLFTGWEDAPLAVEGRNEVDINIYVFKYTYAFV
jgi:2,3-bisphosphoglycerate-dependent phosphoglycerate mutase